MVQAVPVFGSGGSSAKRGFLYLFQHSLTGKDGSGFGSWKTVLAVPLSVSGKTVPTVPVYGSGSVPEPLMIEEGGFQTEVRSACSASMQGARWDTTRPIVACVCVCACDEFCLVLFLCQYKL